MSDLILLPRKKKKAADLNVVPVLNVFICIIFILIIGSTFQKLNQRSLPPSQTVTVNTVSQPPPLNPKLFVLRDAQGVHHLRLEWAGPQPGSNLETLLDGDVNRSNIVQGMLKEFLNRFPEEDTVQLSLTADVSYKVMIQIMDDILDYGMDPSGTSAKKAMNIALSSYEEAQTRMGYLASPSTGVGPTGVGPTGVGPTGVGP